MNDKKIYLDEKGYKEYLKDIDSLINKLQNNSKEKSASYKDAVGDGWHDNFAFEELKRQEISIIQEINRKKDNIKNIVVINEKNIKKDVIKINDIVKLEISFSDDDKEVGKYKLTGGIFPKEKKDYQEITINSPIGKAIYHKKVGTQVKYLLSNNRHAEVNILEKVGDLNDD